MGTPDRLIDLSTPAVRAATRAYLKSRDAAAFERAMERALAKAHATAFIRGTADRTGVMPKGLSRAERADIKARLASELDFLKGFVRALPDLSDAEIANRAALYTGAPRATYYQAWAGNDAPDVLPGSCPQCYGRCRCSLSRESDGIHWIATNDKNTCQGCRERGESWRPYRRK